MTSDWHRKVVSIDDALKLIPMRGTLVAAMAASEPQAFFSKLHDVARTRQFLTVYCANPGRDYPCFSDPTLEGHLELRAMFLTHAVRKRQGHGVVHYVPQHLSQWARNVLAAGPVDIFWGSCSLPDPRGYVSLGVGACYETEIVRQARIVVLEVNKNMPATFGATQLPLEQVTAFVEHHHDLPNPEAAAITANDHKIGELIASLVPDGATLQLGIGAIPNAVAHALRFKKDLGIHTEMINDAMVDLYESGVITGRHKSIWPGKIVGAFAFGSKKLYDFIHDNPIVELHPASVVNDIERIGRNHRMVSINTAVEVDVTGQVCSESIGHMELSGVGGASETHIGAQRSDEGRAIIALHSTAKDGAVSKIVFELKPGAKVSISRNDVDTVVTEQGVAHLRGRSVAERARALIAIADPRFRVQLEKDARSVGYI